MLRFFELIVSIKFFKNTITFEKFIKKFIETFSNDIKINKSWKLNSFEQSRLDAEFATSESTLTGTQTQSSCKLKAFQQSHLDGKFAALESTFHSTRLGLGISKFRKKMKITKKVSPKLKRLEQSYVDARFANSSKDLTASKLKKMVFSKIEKNM